MRLRREFTERQREWPSYREIADISAVENQLFEALSYMNQHPELVKSFAGFSWIVTNL